MGVIDSATIDSAAICSAAGTRRWVWQGSTSRLQGRTTVNVTITACPEEVVRWSESYDFEHSDLVAVADEVATRMMRESYYRTRWERGTPGSARWYLSQRTAESNAQGLSLVREALPDYPDLSAELSRLLVQALFEGYGDPAQNVNELRDLAEGMRTADPNDQLAHIAAGWAGLFGGDRELMLRGFARALELQPQPVAHQLLAAALTLTGRLTKQSNRSRRPSHRVPTTPRRFAGTSGLRWLTSPRGATSKLETPPSTGSGSTATISSTPRLTPISVWQSAKPTWASWKRPARRYRRHARSARHSTWTSPWHLWLPPIRTFERATSMASEWPVWPLQSPSKNWEIDVSRDHLHER